MTRCVVLIGIICSQVPAATAQELPMRKSSVWDGKDTGPPSQKWTPGIQQQESKRQQEILHGWQDAEHRSYETRVTPQHVLRDLQAKIQQTHVGGDYATEAATWSNLAQTITAPGMAPYAQGLDVWTCYKGEVSARLAHIKQVQPRDVRAEFIEWEMMRPLAAQLAGHEPANAQWPFLEGMSYFKSGPASYTTARQWFARSTNIQGCQPEIKAACETALAQMKAEEDRLRKEAEERAARERAAEEARAREREKESDADQARMNKFKEAAKHVPDGVTPEHYLKWLTLTKGSENSVSVAAAYGSEALNNKNWKELAFFMNQVIPYHSGEHTWYTWRAQAELNLGQLQQSLDDIKRARDLGDNRQVLIDMQKDLEARLRH